MQFSDIKELWDIESRIVNSNSNTFKLEKIKNFPKEIDLGIDSNETSEEILLQIKEIVQKQDINPFLNLKTFNNMKKLKESDSTGVTPRHKTSDCFLNFGNEEHQNVDENMNQNKKEEAKFVRKQSLDNKYIGQSTFSNLFKQKLSEPYKFLSLPTLSNSIKQKKIKVFFFETMLNMKLGINLEATVKQVITSIIYNFLNNESYDSSLIKFPLHPEAYELRFLEDDDDCKVELSFDPLAMNKHFFEYNIESVAFCEKLEWINNYNSKKNDRSKDKTDELKKIIDKKQKNLLQITVEDQNFSTLIVMDQKMLIKELLTFLKRKIKFTKEYLIYCEEENIEEELDMNMPLGNLKANKIKLKAKSYADEPIYSVQKYTKESEDQIDDPKNSIILNENQASKYEEFELVKINRKGKRLERILGINQFKIINKIKESNNCKIKFIYCLLLDSISTFFYYFSTGAPVKNSQILIENIKDVDWLTSNSFYIDYIKKFKIKRKNYESEYPFTLSYIISKLQFLMLLQKKNQKLCYNLKTF